MAVRLRPLPEHFTAKKKHISTDITRRKEKNKEIKIAEEETVSNPREFMHAT